MRAVKSGTFVAPFSTAGYGLPVVGERLLIHGKQAPVHIMRQPTGQHRQSVLSVFEEAANMMLRTVTSLGHHEPELGEHPRI